MWALCNNLPRAPHLTARRHTQHPLSTFSCGHFETTSGTIAFVKLLHPLTSSNSNSGHFADRIRQGYGKYCLGCRGHNHHGSVHFAIKSKASSIEIGTKHKWREMTCSRCKKQRRGTTVLSAMHKKRRRGARMTQRMRGDSTTQSNCTTSKTLTWLPMGPQPSANPQTLPSRSPTYPHAEHTFASS